MKTARLTIYRSDESGRLILTRSCVRYIYEELCRDQEQSRSAAIARDLGAELESGERLRSLCTRAARIRNRIRRLQCYPQYWRDPEMRRLTWLYLRLEDLLGNMMK